jgi:hypothetical protein
MVYKKFVKGLKIFIKGAAATFTTIIAISIAFIKETSHDYIHCLYASPAYIMCIPGSLNLTSKLAKLSL